MSLLHQEEMDDAARGEALTRGTSHVVWAAIVAVLVVTAAIAIYVIAGQKPPLASGEVVSVRVHPIHSQSSGYDANGVPVAQESFDQVMVFAQVRLRNQGKIPLFLYDIAANAGFNDGVHTSYAASAGNYDRVFAAYPDMPVPHGTPLPLEATIDPGKTLDGSFVCAFKMTKEQWDAHKSLNFTFSFRYQPSLVLTPHGPVTEQ